MPNQTRKFKSKNNTRNKKKRTQRFREKTYNQEDYSSGDGMLTTVWGPNVWMLLHTMSFNYPVNPTKEEKKHYRDFVLSLKHVLPCKYCRLNIVKNFKTLPLTMDKMKDRESFSRYIYDLHELVNTMLKKKSNLTYDDVRERYEHFRARCTKDIKEKPLVIKPVLNRTRKKEKGCTEPLYGKKSKCVLKIVPQEEKIETFQMDKKCIKVK